MILYDDNHLQPTSLRLTMSFSDTLKVNTAILISALALTACGDSVTSSAGSEFNGGTDAGNGTGSGTITFDKTQMLVDLTDQVFVPAITNFESMSRDQITAINTYCDALIEEQSIDTALLIDAQNSWKQAMTSWQTIEVMQVGPLVSNDAQLRNELYSWPVTNQCAVDQDVGFFEDGSIAGSDYDISRRTVSRRGLDALEHLLFNDTLNHSCSSDDFAPSGWNQRPELERQIARCEYAVEVATDLNNSAQTLVNKWTNNGDSSYADVLKNAETNGEFDSIDAAINTISDALFYIDKITKDAKLGAPVGLIANSCGTATCIDDLESPFASHSLANIRANMVAMQQVFFGGTAATHIGFDDYLVAVNAADLADTMSNDIQAMIDAIDQFEGDFNDAVVNDPAKVQALYEDIKKVTDNLKSAFITFLSLQLPASSAGDAD